MPPTSAPIPPRPIPPAPAAAGTAGGGTGGLGGLLPRLCNPCTISGAGGSGKGTWTLLGIAEGGVCTETPPGVAADGGAPVLGGRGGVPSTNGGLGYPPGGLPLLPPGGLLFPPGLYAGIIDFSLIAGQPGRLKSGHAPTNALELDVLVLALQII